MDKKLIIVAPHPDDEIIGCFEVLGRRTVDGDRTHVLYPNCSVAPAWTERGVKELDIEPVFGTHCDLYLKDEDLLYSNDVRLLFPDPIHETHPEHRRLGAIGECLLRKGANVFFYSVNMQAPYIREVRSPDWKRKVLEEYYPEKADLWQYDHRYFLFEGYCKWLVGSWLD